MATRTNKSYPIQHYVKIMLSISFIVLILDFVISISSIAIVKQQSTRYLQDTADIYINRIDHDFTYIKNYMGWTLAHDENMEMMNDYPVDSPEYIKSNEKLYWRYSELQKNYAQDFNFFYYLKDQPYFLNCAPISIPYSDYQELKRQIMVFIDDNNVYEKYYSQWRPILIKDKHYIINIVPYHNSFMISMISADNLIEPLSQINLGENGFVSLISDDGLNVSSPITSSGKLINPEQDSSPFMNLIQTRTNVNSEFSNASFYVKLVIQFGIFEKIMIAQMLTILLAVIIIFNICFLTLYFKRRVLTPIKIFSYNLSYWTDDNESLNMESSKLIELEKANKQFFDLVMKIKKIKIDLYEREIEKQRIQLNYMKLQIKPHFFLNCLTNIHSMAQMQMYTEIQNMALSTSKYFRYIFQNDQDFVKLENELEHVRLYLEIQQHRYQNAFIYHIEQEEQTVNMEIPPLMLQTFIENAIKYAISRVNEVEILLTVKHEPDENMIVISISDTGPGFPQDVLDKLNGGHALDQIDGTRIGIMNTIQRLEYLYLKKAQISFANLEGGGACITLYLPDLNERQI
ncbi:sensor histidine kinase [Paenibacillus sp. FA6]|uniref:sensor histidine kinase n=1 Tax=Paenibacillus sp. FA6 TaxID=3413029 RepID=UPI003F656C78